MLAFSLLLSGALAGEVIRCPVTRDTWVSTAQGEQDGNNGGESKLKTKGYQEFALVDLDPEPLRGRVVLGAKLHIRAASPDPQRRVTVSTIATDWVEGDETGYDVQAGSASFRWAAQDERPWLAPGDDITAAILGQGNTIWRWADATPPDADGWQSIVVDPDVVAARVAGLSHGFLVFDDVGSEYTRAGERFEYRRFLNRFFYSREAGVKNAPYFTIEVGPEDREAPEAIGKVTQTANQEIRWSTPRDRGPSGVIGFVARWSTSEWTSFDWELARPVPQHLLSIAGEPNEAVTMTLDWLRDLHPGRILQIGLRAVDRAGNVSPVTGVDLADLEPRQTLRVFDDASKWQFKVRNESRLPRVAGLEVAVVDALDKVDARTGALLPEHDSGYRLANHLWSSLDRRIRLFAARNEVVDFQVVLSGGARDVRMSLEVDGGSSRIYRCANVDTKRGLLPDPLVPLTASFSLPAGAEDEAHASFLAEIHVARDARGRQRGLLAIDVDGETLMLEIELNVWKFALPDRLSFLPEMNAYALPDDDCAWYRLAQEHRTVLNRLGYDWRGKISRGCGPDWDGSNFDWAAYDAHFGPYLDGSAFSDLPRGAVPVEAFYLPLNENWPIPIESGFRGGYWADEALAPAYFESFSRACAQFAAHANAKGWNDTLFEFYLNNKIYFKETEWSRSSAPWIFDEPENTQDFFALRAFGAAFHAGIARERGSAALVFRCDLSRPEWRRNLLDGVCDVAVVGDALRRYPSWVIEKKERFGEIVQNYSTANAIDESNAMPVAWCLDAWTLGADGVIPWQTIGSAESWKKADTLALLYPGQPVGSPVPLPSLRLKAFRRGQQDVEYLVLLAAMLDKDRWEMARAAREVLALSTQSRQRSSDDAGTLAYPEIGPLELWNFRVAQGERLDRNTDESVQPLRPGWADRDRQVQQQGHAALPARPGALRPPPRAAIEPGEAFHARARDTR